MRRILDEVQDGSLRPGVAGGEPGRPGQVRAAAPGRPRPRDRAGRAQVLRAMMPWSEEGQGSGSAAARSPEERPAARRQPGDRCPVTMAPRTLFEKVWDAHVVEPAIRAGGGRRCSTWTSTWCTRSPRRRPSRACGSAGRRVRRPDLTVATVDHNVPTGDRRLPIADEISARQVAALVRNARESGSSSSIWTRPEQGIVHVIGPELGLTQPGMVIVCGDSHTSTHGAFGALAFGIGTSEVEHVLATQCIVQTRPRTMEVHFAGRPAAGVTAQGPDPRADSPHRDRGGDRPRHRVHRRGDPGALDGRPDDGVQHVHRGGRAGRDDRAGRRRRSPISQGRPRAPRGAAWTRALAAGRRSRATRAPGTTRPSSMDAAALAPQVTWGTSPGMTADITERVPDPADAATDARAPVATRARSSTWISGPGRRSRGAGGPGLSRLLHQRPDRRSAGGGESRAQGRRVAGGVRAMVVPGLAAGEGRGRGRRAGSGLHARRASSGATRAARCASA